MWCKYGGLHEPCKKKRELGFKLHVCAFLLCCSCFDLIWHIAVKQNEVVLIVTIYAGGWSGKGKYLDMGTKQLPRI